MSLHNSQTANALMPKVGLGLTALLFAMYSGFILLGSFDPALLATPALPGTHINFAFVYGLAVTLSTIVLAGIYVLIANLTE